MIKLNLAFAKCFKKNKITEKLLNLNTLKEIEYPNIKVMIIEDNLDFSLINDISKTLGLKISAFKLDNEETLKNYVVKNANINGTINQDIIFYQVKSKDIKLFSNIIKPNFILINKTDDIINLDENKDVFENAHIIFNKSNYQFKGISYSLNDSEANYYINNIDYIKEYISINNQYIINFKKQDSSYLEQYLMLFALFTNIYNTERIINSFNELNFKKFSYKNKNIFIDIDEMNYNEAIKFIARYNDYKVLVIGWRNSHEDISWLYNVEMERLINKNIQKIYCIGTNAYDIATRIKYADFNEKNIIVSPNIDLVLNEIKNYNLNLYILTDKYYINTIKENK